MSSQLYPKGKKKLLDADIDMLVDDIRIAYIHTASQAYNSAHEFYSDLAGGAIVATSASDLTGKVTTSGLFDADDKTITAVTGATIEAIVMYKWTGSGATSALIAWFDLATSFTPNGADITTVWNGSGIFAI